MSCFLSSGDNYKLSIGVDSKMIMIIFYSAMNLGDDLFVIHLCNHYQDKQFLMYCPYRFSHAFKSIANLKLVYNKENIRYYHSSIELQILIGGSLFMQPESKDDIYNKFLFNKSYRYFDDIPFIIVGTNFGPYDNIKHYELHKEWFSTLNHITFRDKYSFQLFDDLKNISYAPDMIFSYLLPNVERNHTIGISCICNNNRIGLSKYNEKNYIDFLVELCNMYIEKGYNVALYSFCIMQKDSVAMQKIFNKIKNKEQVSMIEYNGDTNSFLKDLLSCEYIIGTRFHSIVLALNAGIPVFPIIYNIKTKNLLTDLNFLGHYVTIEDCNNIDFEFVDYNRKTNIKYDSFSEKALKHFSCIERYLKNSEGTVYDE